MSSSRVHLAPVPSDVPPRRDDLDEYLQAVEALLRRHLERVDEQWQALVTAGGGLALHEVDPVGAVRDLIARGGKRTRPTMTFLGRIAATGPDDQGEGYEAAVRAGAAIELLHSFALIHDDVMDESSVRRGAATVHRSARDLHKSMDGRGSPARFGDSIAVLAGDLAHAEADHLAGGLPERMREIWHGLVLELVAGQFGDLTGTAAGDRRVGFARAVARYKTGGYSVARPLQLGAASARASETTVDLVGEFGRHAGEAFALRDELLGVFGDPVVTGKPADDDLRDGKPTVLLALATDALDGPAARSLARVGTPALDTADCATIRGALHAGGVVDVLEQMIDDRVADAAACVRSPGITDAGAERLTRAVHELAYRQH